MVKINDLELGLIDSDKELTKDQNAQIDAALAEEAKITFAQILKEHKEEMESIGYINIAQLRDAFMAKKRSKIEEIIRTLPETSILKTSAIRLLDFI